jgi:hypothetical protein
MRAHRRQNQTIAGYRAKFRAGDFFHGVDQHRQPQFFTVCRPGSNSSCLKLLTHRLFLPSADPDTNPEAADSFPKTLPEALPDNLAAKNPGQM